MTGPRAAGLHLGWQYATPDPDPGPPPRRPTPPERQQVHAGWVAAQRREENLLSRPLRAACGLSAAALAAVIAAGIAGWLNVIVVFLGASGAAWAAALSANAIWQGERALRARVAAERLRLDGISAEAERRLFAGQAEHATLVRCWQASRLAFEQQKRWYAVNLPEGTGRIDIAGGTLAGWSAMLTTAGAYRLAEGGAVTVLDLTEAAVALDLVGLAGSVRALGSPRVWVLPEDLPRLDLGAGLDGQALADVLSLAVSASEERGTTRDLSVDSAILERIIEVLGARPPVAAITAALRALAQVGNPADDVAAGLISADQVDRLRAMFGKGAAERVVIERAWTLESQLRKLAPLGTGTEQPVQPGGLRVVALSRQAGALDSKVLGAYLAVALTHALRQAGPPASASPWQHTLFVLGADKLRADVLDRLCDACESTGTGLVLAYRTLAPHVKQRLGRGDAAVGLMRLGNAEDAKAASEQLGTEHRFVLSQLTETVGQSVTDTTGGAYTSTTGRTDSVSASTARSDSDSSSVSASRRGIGQLGADSRSVQVGQSRAETASESVSAGLSLSTAWGRTTSAATGSSESAAYALQRSREFLVEQHELQQLPVSAMIISYAGPEGRELTLTDVNPGIGALSSTTMGSLPEAGTDPAPPAEAPPLPRRGFGAEPPNLGPPPPRLDWRRQRS
jgi:hypothetical protein